MSTELLKSCPSIGGHILLEAGLTKEVLPSRSVPSAFSRAVLERVDPSEAQGRRVNCLEEWRRRQKDRVTIIDWLSAARSGNEKLMAQDEENAA